jgi:hypothetical protein
MPLLDFQTAIGLNPRLFEAFADIWTDVAGVPLADSDPESVKHSISASEVVGRLRQSNAYP